MLKFLILFMSLEADYRITVVQSWQQKVTVGLGLNCLVDAPCLDDLLVPLSFTGNKGFETASWEGGGSQALGWRAHLSWRWELLALMVGEAASPGMLLQSMLKLYQRLSAKVPQMLLGGCPLWSSLWCTQQEGGVSCHKLFLNRG